MTISPELLLGSLVGLLTAFVVHEYAHARAAYALGDPTAKYAGRLTLNPLVHLDPIGSIAMVASTLMTNGQLVMGWGKPVLFQRENFRHPTFDAALVALAGPLSNFTLAFALAPLLTLGLPLPWLFALIIKANIGFGLFNSFPLPPLDGWKILQAFVPGSLGRSMDRFEHSLGIYAPMLLLALSPVLISPLLARLYFPLVGLLVHT